jgi:cullin-associated NEDD8-dissociated protein 1
MHSLCLSSKLLHQQYSEVRADIALVKDFLLPITANVLTDKSEQVCERFGIHPSFKTLHRLYNDGDALFFANTGMLAEPITKEQFLKKQKPVPKPLFGHNTQTRYTQSADGKNSHRKDGVLGRMMDVLTNRGVTTGSYLVGGGGGTIGGSICLNPESSKSADRLTSDAKIPLMSSFSKGLDGPMAELMNRVSKSPLAENFAQDSQRAIKRSVTLNNMLKKTRCITGTGQQWAAKYGRFAQQFHTVALAIKANAEGTHTEREIYAVSMGGFDTHFQSNKEILEKFEIVDNALEAFEKEMKAQDMWNSIVVIQSSEFGRRLTSNGDGTGHGWAGNYFIMGGAVKGGQILGKYPEDLTEAGSDVASSGRVIPSTSWDQIWNGIAEWYGVENMDLHQVVPNRDKFEATLFKEEDIFTYHFPTGYPTPVPTTGMPTNTPTPAPTPVPTSAPTKQKWLLLKANDQGAKAETSDTFTPFTTQAIRVTHTGHGWVRATEIVAYDTEGNKITPVGSQTNNRLRDVWRDSDMSPELYDGDFRWHRAHGVHFTGWADIYFGEDVTISKLVFGQSTQHATDTKSAWSWSKYSSDVGAYPAPVTDAPTANPTPAPTAAPTPAPTKTPEWLHLKVNDQGKKTQTVDTFTPFTTDAIRFDSTSGGYKRLTEIVAYDIQGNMITPVGAHTDNHYSRNGVGVWRDSNMAPELYDGSLLWGRGHGVHILKWAVVYFASNVTIAKIEINQAPRERDQSSSWKLEAYNPKLGAYPAPATNVPTANPTPTPTVAPTPAPTKYVAPTQAPTFRDGSDKSDWDIMKVNDQGVKTAITDTFEPFTTTAIRMLYTGTAVRTFPWFRVAEIIARDTDGNIIQPEGARTDSFHSSWRKTDWAPQVFDGTHTHGRDKSVHFNEYATVWFGKDVTIASLEVKMPVAPRSEFAWVKYKGTYNGVVPTAAPTKTPEWYHNDWTVKKINDQGAQTAITDTFEPFTTSAIRFRYTGEREHRFPYFRVAEIIARDTDGNIIQPEGARTDGFHKSWRRNTWAPELTDGTHTHGKGKSVHFNNYATVWYGKDVTIASLEVKMPVAPRSDWAWTAYNSGETYADKFHAATAGEKCAADQVITSEATCKAALTYLGGNGDRIHWKGTTRGIAKGCGYRTGNMGDSHLNDFAVDEQTVARADLTPICAGPLTASAPPTAAPTDAPTLPPPTASTAFTLGGSNPAYPGYGCLNGENDVTLSDNTLAQCEAACVARSTCKSFDFYVARTGHTCSLSDSNFADVGSTSSTTDCRYYEKAAVTGDELDLVDNGGSGCSPSNPCPVCHGDCDDDSQCQGELKCFQRSEGEAVPGCIDGPGAQANHDFCYADPALAIIPVSGGNDGAATNLARCTGECDGHHQCAAGLECFERTHGEAIPGCDVSTAPGGDWDYCYNPASRILTGDELDLVDNGGSACSPSNPCPVCHGDCDDDSQCQGELKCFQRSEGEAVPGCLDGPGILTAHDFCYAEPALPIIPVSGGNDGAATNLARCTGECDGHHQCAAGLQCFERENGEAIPGCDVTTAPGGDWDYCYKP